MSRELAEAGMLTEIATFLSGIFFAAILLVYQLKDNLEPVTLENLTWAFSVSCILFVYLALSCLLKLKSGHTVAFFGLLFFSAFTSFFVSLYLLLSLISQTIALVSMVITVVLFVVFVFVAVTGS